jgi:hypothetical protein
MGLDATVMCNCYREGRASEPPVPRACLHLDETGLWVSGEGDTEEMQEKVEQWQQSACGHEGMFYLALTVANWPHYRAFLRVLERVGEDRVPALWAALPLDNDGQVDAVLAAQARDDLDAVWSLGTLGENTYLVNSATGEEAYHALSGGDGVLSVSPEDGGLQVGVDREDFFVRSLRTGLDCFRARRFRQTPLAAGPGSRPGPVELLDLDTGRGCRLTGPVPGRAVRSPDGTWQFDVPSYWHVVTRPIRPWDFRDMLAAFDKLFLASAVTGNPVCWH